MPLSTATQLECARPKRSCCLPLRSHWRSTALCRAHRTNTGPFRHASGKAKRVAAYYGVDCCSRSLVFTSWFFGEILLCPCHRHAANGVTVSAVIMALIALGCGC